jgi:sugar phosphate permease
MTTQYAPMRFFAQRETLFAWLVWACAASYYFYQFILRVSPGILSHDLMRDFAINGCALGILDACYYQTYAIMQIPLGMLMDRFGPRRVLAVSCSLAAGGTLIFALSPDLAIASFGRLLVGAGAACGFIGTLKVSTLWFPMEKVGRMIGLTMLLGTLGGIFGGAPLGFMKEYLGWRSTLMMLSLLGFSLALTIYLIVRDRGIHPPQLKTVAPSKGFFSGLYCVIMTKQVWLLAIFGCLMYVPLAALADLWGTPFLAELYHVDLKIAASMISSVWFGVALGSPLTVWLSDYTKSRRLPMVLASVASLILFSVIIYKNNIPLELMYVLMFLGGFAFTGQNLIFASVAEIMPLSASGVAVGFLNMIVMLSGVIFKPLVGKLLDLHWDKTMLCGLPAFTAQDYQFALLPIPIVLVIATCLVKFIRETYPRSTEPVATS